MTPLGCRLRAVMCPLAVGVRQHVIGVAVVQRERLDVQPPRPKRVNLALNERVGEAGVEGGEVCQPNPGLRRAAVSPAHLVARPRLRSAVSIAET